MNIHQLQQYLGNNLWHGENSHRQNRVQYMQGIPFLHRQLIVSLVMPDGTRVWGLDLSHWNRPPVNLKRMVELYGLKFVIIKGCDGSVNSKYYFEHVAAAKEAGIPWGKYDWLYPAKNVNMDAQINAWHARYMIDPPRLGVFIDAEWTNYGGLPANPNANDLRQAHDKWKNKSGQVATTYTAKGYADTYLIGFDWTREPLWVASWGGNAPLLPMGAKGHLFWQFAATLNGKLLDPNGNAELDGNYFNGTQAEFNQRYGVIIPPNGGTTMEYIKGTTKAATSAGGLRVRKTASSTAEILGSLPFGTPVEGYLQNGWIEIQYNGQKAYISAEWVTYTIVAPPVPDGVELAFTENGVTKRYKMTGKWEVS